MQDYRFWGIIFSLCTVSLLASLETTVIVTSLPSIVADLEFGESYVWVGNIFFLTSAIVQPLFGQISNLFGRRYPTLFVVALYTLGSGICGGAVSPAMMIVGRAIQGAGSGGINLVVEVIVSDLVPLRDRGYFMAIVLLVYSIGSTAGPAVGGAIVENTSWRWVFYINLPVGGLCLVSLWAFLRVRWDRTATIASRLQRLDYIGNALFTGSTISVLLALTWAGVTYPWSDYHVLAPLLIGFAGMALFIWFESSSFVPGGEPVMPVRIFANRTSATVYALTFLNSTTLYWIFFFVPLYFQGVLLVSPTQSGVYILPITLVAIPGAAMAAVALSRWGRYKPLHIVGFALVTIGFGLFSLMDRHTSTGEWVGFQIIPAIGGGLILNTLLPAFQAPLLESDQAAATASWAFIRSFGSVWGVAVPATIFNTYTSRYASRVDNEMAQMVLRSGDAYASATRDFVMSFPEPVRSQMRDVYTEAFRMVFLVGIAVAGSACLISFLEEEIVLRKELETEFGIDTGKEGAKETSEMEGGQTPVATSQGTPMIQG
ncbi:major facilitator superfamily domain-containing protein [Stachybotrys elegans]|uniref:Major facilitator superfamily domain-containing protein n=1 Tax=Stachybotrys elegans TaxID=80388 RepID=A0A8K0WZ66_9HYPO|nr:major facilitator superfamily domain-containing protein [Stachybotrys elegans]